MHIVGTDTSPIFASKCRARAWLSGAVEAIADLDPVLAAAIERAEGMNRERGLRRAQAILDAMTGPGHAAAVREAVRMAQEQWPAAMLWGVSSADPRAPYWLPKDENEA